MLPHISRYWEGHFRLICYSTVKFTIRSLYVKQKSSKYSKLLSQGELERLRGQLPPDPYPPRDGSDFDPEDFVRRSFHEIWNWRLLNRVNDYYRPNYLARVSTNRQLYGLGDLKAYILGWLAAFSDLVVLVDHVCWLNDGPGRYRIATRWTLQGTHDGPSVYGAPTGKRIRLIGITHHEVQDGRFVREWSVFDEFALLKQLYAPLHSIKQLDSQ